MKFTASKDTLLQQLQIVGGAISTNTTLPILEDFLFTLSGNTLRITATDLETSMATDVEVAANKNGTIAIPAKLLLDTLKSLPEQPLIFDIDPDALSVQLTISGGSYKLLGEPGEDFPFFPEVLGEENFSIPSTILKKAIDHTLFAVNTNELRPAMNGVYFDLTASNINFVATDGYKLAKFTRSDVANNTAHFIIPKKALTLLRKALPKEEVPVLVKYDDTNAFFSFEGVDLVCRLIDARFPNYNAVVPNNNTQLLTIDRQVMLTSLKRISMYANKTTYQVNLAIEQEQLTLFAQDFDFENEAKETLTCVYNGDAMEIAFNARFLIEILSVLRTPDITFQLSTPQRACLIVPTEQEEQEDILMLVIPTSV
ncbi:MAG: DNA polymerase III subunit beta [Chitinophagales bacterium]